METMKNQMKKVVQFSILKLESHFSSHGVMEVLRVVFGQY